LVKSEPCLFRGAPVRSGFCRDPPFDDAPQPCAAVVDGEFDAEQLASLVLALLHRFQDRLVLGEGDDELFGDLA